MHEHARPLNKRFARRPTTGSAFIKMACLKAVSSKFYLLVGLGECARDLIKCVPWVPEDIFFLIGTDGSWQSRINDAQIAEEKELSISTDLFHRRYFEDGPPEPGCKMCSLQKSLQKKKTSNMVSTKAK